MTNAQRREPQLRFPEFSEEWKSIIIAKLIESKAIIGHLDGNHGELYPRSEEFSEEGVPYIAANNLVNGEVDFEKCKRLPLSRAAKFKKGIARDGDVLFAHNATVGPVSLLKTNHDFVVLSTTVTYFRFDEEKLSNHFFKFLLETDAFIHQCHRVKFQSTRLQVPITAQRKFRLDLPRLNESQKISSFLSSVDKKISQLKQKHEQLVKYKKGIMQQLFSQKLRFKDEHGRDFPDWKKDCLGNHLEEYREKSKIEDQHEVLTSARSGIVRQQDYFRESRLIERSNIGFNVVPKGYITYRSRSDDRRFYFNLNDTGEIGVISTYYPVFKMRNGVNQFFIELSRIYERTFGKYSVGTSQTVLSFNEMKNIKVKIPCDKEQQKIACFSEELDRKINLSQQQIEQTQAYKQGLLQQMFV
ncbi:restriction endonuclease subunit S [Aliamphritea hakodatensis]|uniref:restriction endonuclease subunit S n=1 Tax=Aliamphritea hakodatensis TaxID=2895352 RepID=UPI0022FD37FE|nr:restriction endonuclease subunit S [Aliamphritea hakodatensis]